MSCNYIVFKFYLVDKLFLNDITLLKDNMRAGMGLSLMVVRIKQMPSNETTREHFSN